MPNWCRPARTSACCFDREAGCLSGRQWALIGAARHCPQLWSRDTDRYGASPPPPHFSADYVHHDACWRTVARRTFAGVMFLAPLGRRPAWKCSTAARHTRISRVPAKARSRAPPRQETGSEIGYKGEQSPIRALRSAPPVARLSFESRPGMRLHPPRRLDNYHRARKDKQLWWQRKNEAPSRCADDLVSRSSRCECHKLNCKSGR
jgi:hypothetical protein